MSGIDYSFIETKAGFKITEKTAGDLVTAGGTTKNISELVQRKIGNSNNLYLGWDGNALTAQVDVSDLGVLWGAYNFNPDSKISITHPVYNITQNNINSWNEAYSNQTTFEKIANKQNSLAVDGTGVKFPTVDAVNDRFSNFLPYTGATQSVNLNTQQITSVGKINNGATYREVANYGRYYDIFSQANKLLFSTQNEWWDGTAWTSSPETSVHIGENSGAFSRGSGVVNIGRNSGQYNNATNALNIGRFAGQNNTGVNAVNVGSGAGQNNTQNDVNNFGTAAGGTNSGAYTNNFGQNAGRYNTGGYTNNFGQYAGENNTGLYVNNFGQSAGRYNTVQSVNNFGLNSGLYNIGHSTNNLGQGAGQFNRGIYGNNIGVNTGGFNTNDYTIFMGIQSGQYNTGYGNIGLGFYTNRYAQGNSNHVFGHNSNATFKSNTAGNKTFDYTAIDTTAKTITIPSHGFGNAGAYVNLRFTQGTSAITGISNGDIIQVKIVDANTLLYSELLPSGQYRHTNNITNAGTGTGHIFTPQFTYSNVNILGNGLEPTKSSQNIISGGEFLMPQSTVATLDADTTNKTLITKEWFNSKIPSYSPTTHTHQSLYAADSLVVDANTLFEDYKFKYNQRIYNGSTNMFPTPNNANAVISIGSHSGGYGAQIGFNDYNRIFFRKITANTWGSWKEFAFQDWVTTQLAGYALASGTINYIPKFTASGTIGNSLIYDNGTNVGIGTASPQRKLHIANGQPNLLFDDTSGYPNVSKLEIDVLKGTSTFRALNGTYGHHATIFSIDLNQGIVSNPAPLFNLTNSAAKTVYGGNFRVGVEPSTNFVIQDTASSQNVFEIAKNGLAGSFYIRNNGNVGIGTTSPSEKLDVNGNVKSNSYKFNLPSSITAQANMLIPKTDGTRPTWYNNSSVANDLAFKSDVDNLQIGGRNYFSLSKLTGYAGGNIGSSTSFYTIQGARITAVNQPMGSVLPGNRIKVDSQVILVGVTKTDLSSVKIYLREEDETGAIVRGQWTVTFNKYVILNLTATTKYINIGIGNDNVVNYFIDGVYIVSGSKDVGWSPSPEDKQDRLQDITGNVGIGKSDTIATEKLDVNGNIKATSFIKSGGTSSQFLMADGSVNSNTYSVTTHTHTFASLTSKPTTLSGYGITDAVSQAYLQGITISNTGGGAWIDMPIGGYSAIGSGGQGVDAWIAKTDSNGQFFTDAIAGDLISRNTTGKIMWGNTSSYAGMYLQNNILNLINVPKVNGNNVALESWVNNKKYLGFDGTTMKQITSSNFNDVVDGEGNVWLGDIYNVGTNDTGLDFNYGTILNINGKGGHDKTQLIFNGGNGDLMYRKSWYQNTAWTPLRRIWDSNNLNPNNFVKTSTDQYGITGLKEFSDGLAIGPNSILRLGGVGMSGHYIKKFADDSDGFGVSTAFTVKNYSSEVDLFRVNVDGNAQLNGYLKFNTTIIDTTGLDPNTFYPVRLGLSTSRYTKIKVYRDLNSSFGQPSYSNHSNGFMVMFEIDVLGDGWGTTDGQGYLREYKNFWVNSGQETIGFKQMGYSSQAVVYVRGGSKYYFEADTTATPILTTSYYEIYGQSCEPTTTRVWQNFTDMRVSSLVTTGMISNYVNKTSNEDVNGQKSFLSTGTSYSQTSLNAASRNNTAPTLGFIKHGSYGGTLAMTSSSNFTFYDTNNNVASLTLNSLNVNNLVTSKGFIHSDYQNSDYLLTADGGAIHKEDVGYRLKVEDITSATKTIEGVGNYDFIVNGNATVNLETVGSNKGCKVVVKNLHSSGNVYVQVNGATMTTMYGNTRWEIVSYGTMWVVTTANGENFTI